MQPACIRVHEPGQRIQIGILKLRKLTVFHQEIRQHMAAFGQLLENRHISRRSCACFLEYRQTKTRKKNLSQLKIRIDVELNTGSLVDLELDSLALLFETVLQRSEPLQVDCDSCPLDIGQNTDERNFHIVKEEPGFRTLQLRLEDRSKLKRHVRIFAAIVSSCVDRAFVERDRRAPLAAELRVGRHRVIEKFQSEYIQAMRTAAGVENVAGKHGIEIEAPDVHTCFSQNEQVVFRILSGLPDAGI